MPLLETTYRVANETGKNFTLVFLILVVLVHDQVVTQIIITKTDKHNAANLKRQPHLADQLCSDYAMLP